MTEVSVYRNRQAKAQTALIIVVDADINTAQQRLMQLDQSLPGAGKRPISDGERVARLVPKRNIETWILCLNAHTVDEETDYKRTRNDWAELIPGAADALCQWTRQTVELPKHGIKSLRAGIAELKRLEF